jgi:hypothetical protein
MQGQQNVRQPADRPTICIRDVLMAIETWSVHGHQEDQMESVQRPQSSKQSKRPEDQAPAAGAPPTGVPVTGCAAGFISMSVTIGEKDVISLSIDVSLAACLVLGMILLARGLVIY